jgi:hypothetical protein
MEDMHIGIRKGHAEWKKGLNPGRQVGINLERQPGTKDMADDLGAILLVSLGRFFTLFQIILGEDETAK